MKRLNRKTEYFLLVCLFLFIVCILPLLSQSYYYSRNTVTVEQEEIRYASVKNTVVTQEILLQGRISDLKIFFYAPSGKLYRDALVHISIRQDAKMVDVNVPATALLVGGAYDTPPSVRVTPISKRESLYQVRANLSSFTEGWATVSIEGIRLPSGTDLFCAVSQTLVSGLPSAMAGENILGGPLVLEYEVLKYNTAFFYETALFLLLCGICLLTAGLLTWKKDWLARYDLLFLCTFVLIFLFVSIRQPTASFMGEPRSEAAYEFWYKAHENGFFKSLMTLMSGEALAWMERILIWLADVIVPTKYVFVAAQLMELTFISFVAAMPCLRGYRRYFSDEVRMAFSLFLGTSLFFVKIYYFWSVSYWSLLFFIGFALVDLEKLKRWQYAAGLLLSVVLCVSRIFHAVFIPVAVFLLIVLGKRQGRRFCGYCWTMIGGCTFQVIYSMIAGRHLTGNTSLLDGIQQIGFARIFENTLYFQVQALNSLVTGSAHFLGGVSNVFFLLLLFFIASASILLLIKGHTLWEKKLACFLLSLGFISLGTIAITVITSGSYDWVSMPYNYAVKVDWGENYYQTGDLHFSYSYLCMMWILIAGVFFLKEKMKKSPFDVCLKNFYADGKLSHKKVSVVFLCFAFLSMVNVQGREPLALIPTQWQKVSEVTERQEFFLAVNTRYGAAPISLEHHSDELIYGVDAQGKGMLWDPTKPAYEEKFPFSVAELGAVSDIETKEILTVTARKALTNFDTYYVAVLQDKSGRELARIRQANSPDRIWVDFILDAPLKGVYRISFELEDGGITYVQDGVQVGYKLEEANE